MPGGLWEIGRPLSPLARVRLQGGGVANVPWTAPGKQGLLRGCSPGQAMGRGFVPVRATFSLVSCCWARSVRICTHHTQVSGSCTGVVSSQYAPNRAAVGTGVGPCSSGKPVTPIPTTDNTRRSRCQRATHYARPSGRRGYTERRNGAMGCLSGQLGLEAQAGAGCGEGRFTRRRA